MVRPGSEPRLGAAGWRVTRRAVLAALLGGSVVSAAAAAAVDEASAMALCVLRIAQFAAWPAAAFEGPGDPVVVATVGREPSGSKLEDMFRGEQQKERAFVIRRFEADRDPGVCHLLLLGEMDRSRRRELLRAVAGRPVLTVSLGEGFCEDGGMIRLSVTQGRVQILIRRDVVQGARLALDSRLLNLSVVRIYGEPERP